MNRRAVSSTVAYVLALAIAMVLVAGLLVAGSTFIDDQSERVTERELEVIGHHIAGNLEQIDRMVRAGSGSNTIARINQSFNDRVINAGYTVKLIDRSPPVLFLNTTDSSVSTRINVSVETSVSTSQADGGEIAVRYDGSELEVTNG